MSTASRLLAFAAALPLWILPAPLRAQSDFDHVPPQVLIAPGSGPIVGQTLQVTIDWCDNGQGAGIDPSSRIIKIDGTSENLSTWTFTTQPPSQQCAVDKRSQKTVTLAYSQTPHTLHAEVSDFNLNHGAADVSYTVTAAPIPPSKNDVAVQPDYQAVDVERSMPYTQRYSVQNRGAASGTFNLTATCTGTGVTGCALTPASVTLAAGATVDTIKVSVTATSTPGTSATLKLVAQLSTSSVVRDSGMVDVTVTPLAPQGLVLDLVNPGTTVDRGLCLTMVAGPGAAYECGDLRLAHGLPVVQTMGTVRSPTLLYSSNQAHPVIRVAANVPALDTTAKLDSVTVVLKRGTSVVASGKWWGSDSGWARGMSRRVVLSYDAFNLTTKRYTHTVEATRWYQGTQKKITAGIDVIVVNRASSPFGAGWWLAGLEQLVPDTLNWLWVGGDGSARLYTPSGTNRWAAAKVDHPDTLEWNPTTSTYCRRLPHRGCVIFDGTGNQIRSENRLAQAGGSTAWGHRTIFAYDGGVRLQEIKLPIQGDTLRYTFTYDGYFKLNRVVGPTPSDTTLVWVTNGKLLGIRDAGLNALVEFVYDTGYANRIVYRGGPVLGIATTFAFGSANTLSTARTSPGGGAADIVYTWQPVEIKGLPGAAPPSPNSAYTKFDGPRTDVGDSTLFWLDRFGEPSKVMDAYGNETILTRADTNGFLALVTRVRTPDGRVQLATYNNRGYLTAATDSNVYQDGRNAVTTYAWDTTYDFVKRSTGPNGQTDTSSYDPVNGNTLWVQPGGDASRRTTFSYDTVFGHISAIQGPGSPAPITRLYYDSLGNVDSTQSPLGLWSLAYKDHLGRDTLTKTQVDSVVPQATHHYLIERIRYDAAGRDTLHVTFSDSSTDTLRVSKQFDAESHVVLLTSRAVPDLNALGTIQHGYRYDMAGRLVVDSLVGITGSAIPFVYDPAGNLTAGSRSNTANTYDAMNRLIRRLANAADDPSSFAYDAMGRMVEANNAWARITRTWNRNRTLASDTSRVSTWPTGNGDFTQHVYGIRSGYDLSSRRIWMKQPSQLAAVSGQDSVAWVYDSVFGQLAQVRDPYNNKFDYTYDLMGRLTRLTELTGQSAQATRILVYNLASQVAYDTLLGPVFRTDSLWHDARGNVAWASGNSVNEHLYYARLGSLRQRALGAGGYETYVLDALGNRQTSTTIGAQWSYLYQGGSGRLVKRYSGVARDTVAYQSSGVGQIYAEATHHWDPPYIDSILHPQRDTYRVTNSFYDPSGRLLQTEFTVDTVMPQYLAYRNDEYYHYDALGRRIASRMVRGSQCVQWEPSSGCQSILTRTVWDGDQVLAEIRVPGDTTQPPATLESEGSAGQALYGRILYTHGGGIDDPLSIRKLGESFVVLPQPNYRGAVTDASCSNGVCSGVWLAAAAEDAFAGRDASLYPSGPPSWHGSLLENGQDGSGYQYRRNRMYDPKTGRFTSEDPIGLAGGINLYAYAGNNPVTFSDPFGLKKGCERRGNCTQSQIGDSQRQVEQDKHGDGTVDDLSFVLMVATLPEGGEGGAAVRLIGPAAKTEAKVLAEFFGQRAAGALARLESRTLTPGITKEMLENYAATVAEPIVNGTAATGKITARSLETQTARLQLIYEAVKNWF